MFSSDFKTNEKKIMQGLDEMAKLNSKGSKAKASDSKSARDGAEAIREWVSPSSSDLCASLD